MGKNPSIPCWKTVTYCAAAKHLAKLSAVESWYTDALPIQTKVLGKYKVVCSTFSDLQITYPIYSNSVND